MCVQYNAQGGDCDTKVFSNSIWQHPDAWTLQLRKNGRKILDQMGMKSYLIKLTHQDFTSNVYLKLYKCLEGPFYINTPQLWLYLEKDYIMMTLLDNDLKKIIRNCSDK